MNKKLLLTLGLLLGTAGISAGSTQSTLAKVAFTAAAAYGLWKAGSWLFGSPAQAQQLQHQFHSQAEPVSPPHSPVEVEAYGAFLEGEHHPITVALIAHQNCTRTDLNKYIITPMEYLTQRGMYIGHVEGYINRHEDLQITHFGERRGSLPALRNIVGNSGITEIRFVYTNPNSPQDNQDITVQVHGDLLKKQQFIVDVYHMFQNNQITSTDLEFNSSEQVY